MAIFSNTATLTLNGVTTNSNTVTGEILEELRMTKTALVTDYLPGESITFVVTVQNSSNRAMKDLILHDNLGGWICGSEERYPLAYIPTSAKVMINGEAEPQIKVIDNAPLKIANIQIPAGATAVVLYQAKATRFAPLEPGSSIVNAASVNYRGGKAHASAEVHPRMAPMLSIRKSLFPKVIEDGKKMTFTFEIENSGLVPAHPFGDEDSAVEAGNGLVLADIFNPCIDLDTVTLDGEKLRAPFDYLYNPETGSFRTVPGRIRVPAAKVTQADDGSWCIEPGKAVVMISGTL